MLINSKHLVNCNLVLFTLLLITIINSVSLYSINKNKLKSLRPVILFPGLEGSRLEARLDIDISCHKKTSYYFHLWLNEQYLLPPKIDCFLNLLKVQSSPTANFTVRVPSFGDTEAIEHLDPLIRLGPTEYMAALVDSMATLGYVRNVSVRGAPYDFRLAPNDLGDYFTKVDNLIEETYTANGKQRVTLVCHSLGCLVILTYLKEKEQTWKDYYVHQLITVAAPYGGAVKALKALAIGDNLGLFMYSSKMFLEMERSFTSIPFLLPNPKVFGQQTILETPFIEYSPSDYAAIFKWLKTPHVYSNWNRTRHVISEIPFPSVNMTCIYSYGSKTADRLSYSTVDATSNPTVSHGDGDGTVNLASLQYCQNWINMTDQFSVNLKTFSSLSHLGIIKSQQFINYLVTLF